MGKFFWKHKILIFIIALVCFGAFLRFHNLSNLYIFGFDEEYQATDAMTLVNKLHPIWIGVSASFLDYYLGPYFTYFTAFWLWLSHGDPLLTAYVAATVGVVTSLAIFFVGWKFFNLTAGIVSSLLYAGLPLFVFYDQKYWNPMFVRLIVLLMFTSLLMIRKSPWWWLLYSAMVGAIFHTNLALLPLVIIGIWYFIRGKFFLNKKLILSCILVFLFFYWPLIVFDYNHNWSNLTVLSRYSQQAEKSGVKFDPVSKLNSTVDNMGRFWYLSPGRPNAEELNIFCNSQRTYPAFWLPGLSVILLIFFFIITVRSKKYSYYLLGYFLFISLVSYLLYSGGSFEYYLSGFTTLFVIVPGIIVSEANKKFRFYISILIIILLVLGCYTVLNSSDKYSLGPKKSLIQKVMTVVGENSFSVDKMGTCYTYDGWRYLFKVYGKTPAKSFTDENFAWLYPKELSSEPADFNVIVSELGATPDRNLNGYFKIDEGGFSAYVKKLQ